MNAPRKPVPRQPPEKALNVVFNYNGHSWDAYEVLGIPAGSSLEAVQQAFQTLRKTATIDSRGFLDAAFEAIMHEHGQ